MSTVGSSVATLQDWASRIKPDGKIAKIVEILSEQNEILMDMMWMEGNLPTGHKTTIRSGLPTVAWRLLNYGVQPSKSKTVQVTDSCGMLEGYSEVDKDLAELNGNTKEFRLSEDRAFLAQMSNTLASTLFYGSTDSDPEKFMGLAPRYNSLSAENGENILNAGGTGSDNTSVWLVAWGEQTCHGIFPKGKKTGLQHRDLGEETLTDAAGGLYQGYRSHYKWDAGLTLRDWRYAVRVANIDKSLLAADCGTVSAGADIVAMMIKAIHKLPSKNVGKLAFYVNETVETYLDLQTLRQTNTNVSYKDDVHGKAIMTFRGIPVRRCDAILDTESAVS
jgi:hypothetical protein